MWRVVWYLKNLSKRPVAIITVGLAGNAILAEASVQAAAVYFAARYWKGKK